ncbi:hypothetical protein ACHAXS_009813 [Conticribra weissflogii]
MTDLSFLGYPVLFLPLLLLFLLSSHPSSANGFIAPNQSPSFLGNRRNNSRPPSAAIMSTSAEENHQQQQEQQQPQWDPETQTYKNGIVPAHESMSLSLEELLALNHGKLKIFGYGSLCWHPGSKGVLSLANIEEDEHDHERNHGSAVKRKVTTDPGRAIGYQRCWAQRSADHRGTTEFNGIVCTLLSDEEVWRLHHPRSDDDCGEEIREEKELLMRSMRPSMTEGLIYTVHEDLVEDCLAELDFREKGGYARDVIDVVEDDTGNIVKALLYRGTPDNPAFWKRVYFDLPLAAATMSVAIGPSGHNDVYLLNLDKFLTHAAKCSPAAALALEDHAKDDRTGELAKMVHMLQNNYRPYFLFGAGSNEHNQLLLSGSGDECSTSSESNGRYDIKFTGGYSAKEVDELVEMLLVVPRETDNSDATSSHGNHEPVSLHAGGGHSALLTRGGDLYLWGWNQSGQLGRQSKDVSSKSSSVYLNSVKPLANIKVAVADLGHNHTLVIEKETGKLFGFGENGRGQANGCTSGDSCANIHVPTVPLGLSNETFVDVAAGLFHSAAITTDGFLVTWGCGRFGQCLYPGQNQEGNDSKKFSVGRWRTPDGSKLVQVVCGRRHTTILDELGRVWSLGDNKYGQLGRHKSSPNSAREPMLVEGPLGEDNSGCIAIMSGWSHILALVKTKNSTEITLYGWGRNDKGQLGKKLGESFVAIPQILDLSFHNDGDQSISIQSACCGSESSHLLDKSGQIWSCGWNEHGNLGINHYEEHGHVDADCCWTWKAVTGKRIVAPPPSSRKDILFAAGGAHLIAMAT